MLSSRYKNDSLPTLDLNPIQMDMKVQVDTKVKDGNYSFEEIECAICGEDTFERISEKDRYGLYCNNVICKKCGLIMINPRMTQTAYNEFYNAEYRALYTGRMLNAPNFFEGQNLRGKRLLSYLTRYNFIHTTSKERPFVLEVGCGAGGILHVFKENGFEVKGIDLGEEYLSFGRDKFELDLTVGSLKDLELNKSPDVIIYSHVLEHILDLNEEINLIKKICSKDTVVYIEVPGVKNISNGYRNDPLRYFQNAHTYSFSLRTLKNLFLKHNFELLKGDEFVKGVFRISEVTSSSVLENDHKEVIKKLKSAETKRRYYKYSVSRMKMIVRTLLLKVSKMLKPSL